MHWELCKKLKFEHTNNWYIHEAESVPENETQKLSWDFEIQMDHLISARRPGLVIVNRKKKKKKRTSLVVDFAVSADHRLFVWVLQHINLCRLLNAKFIFIQINSFISNSSVL